MAGRQHQHVGSTSDALTVIGEGIVVVGQVHGEEDLRIEGRVEGGISLTETVHVASSGIVVATIDARDVVVSGVVVGNVSASNSIRLEPGAKLVGDMNAPRVIIADGAAFRGNVAMGDAPTDVETRARASRGSSSNRGRTRAKTQARSAPVQASPAAAKSPPKNKKKTAKRAAPRVAAIVPPGSQNADDVTVVVRHSQIEDEAPKATKKKAKKAPPRGRVPKPGKRKVNRR